MASGARTGGRSRTPGSGASGGVGVGSAGVRTGGGAVGPSQTGGAPDHHSGPFGGCGGAAGSGAAADAGTGVVSVVSLAIVVCTRLGGCTGGRDRRWGKWHSSYAFL